MRITGLARLSALFASVVIGGQASRRDYRAMVLTSVIVVLIMAGYYLHRRYRRRTDGGRVELRRSGMYALDGSTSGLWRMRFRIQLSDSGEI